jgi:Tfp pilus assembly protein PilF/peroxiredoxin
MPVMKEKMSVPRGIYKLLKIHIIAVCASALIFFTGIHSASALLQVGTAAPDFSLKDIDGKETGLSGFLEKKAVVLLFWSTWSRKSPQALKRFEDYHSKYGDRGIQVIGVNVDNQSISAEDMDGIKRIVNELGITFPVLIDRGLEIFHKYNVIAVPSTVVIVEGKISYELPALPLVGTEEMFDYLLVLAGEKVQKEVKEQYVPNRRAVANTNLARQMVKKKMHTMAYHLLNKAIETDPGYMLPYIEFARLSMSEGKHREAEEVLRKALLKESENDVVMSELGYLLAMTGKTDESLKLLEKAVKKDSYTPAYYYQAYALSKAGNMEGALEAFEKAISLNPFQHEIYRLRAEAYEENNMLKEAAGDYRKILQMLLNIKKIYPDPPRK